MEAGDLKRDVLLGLQRGNAIQFELQRLQTGSLNSGFIHACGVIVANLLVDGVAVGIVGAGGDESFAQQVLVP